MKLYKSNPFVTKPILTPFLAVAFILNFLAPSLTYSQEVDLNLPAPSKIKAISKPFNPATIRAITVNPNDPFMFDFIIDKGDTDLDAEAFEAESQKLVKYFLAALTIPEADLWVNLSPYEQDAMVSPVLGVTELGKDLLVKDYYLKQVTAQLTNPNTPTGKKFWDLAYKKAQELYGNTNVPINTFSKVWIVPDQATVLEKDGSAFVADSHLKVFLDQDYLAVKKNLDNKEIGTDKLGTEKTQDINNFSAQIIKDVVLPEIEKEVNTGENFAAVRQIYSAAILATWYKSRLKESLLGKLYADQNKVAGVNAEDMDSGEKIFEKYTAALKTGAYNIIKQDYDLSAQKIVQRKYFSGGANLANLSSTTAIKQMTTASVAALSPVAASAVSSAVTEMQRASSGGGTASNYSRVTVKLSNSSSAVLQQVSNRLNLTDQGGAATRFGLAGVRTEEMLANLGFIKPRVVNDSLQNVESDVDSNSDVAAIESLARFSPTEVDAFAKRSGYDSQRLQGLRERILNAATKVKSTEYRQVFKNFISQVRQALTPAVRQSLAQARDLDRQSIRRLETLGTITDEEFETTTRNFSADQAADFADARKKIRSLKAGQTVVNLIADNDTRLNKVIASPALTSFVEKPSDQVVLTDSERKAIAVVFAKTQDVGVRVALTKMGYGKAQMDDLLDSRRQPELLKVVEANSDAFLSAAKIDPTTTVILHKIANPYGNIVHTDEQYGEESATLFSDLTKQGFSRETIDQVVQVRAELKAIVMDRKTITNDDLLVSIGMASYSKPIASFVETLQEKPALTRAFIQPDRLAQDVTTQQLNVAQKLVEMDDTTLEFVVLQNETLTPEQKNAIRSDVALARDLRKLNPQAKIFSGKNGAAIAKAIADPKFVQMVSAVNVRASSAVNAVLAADYLTNADTGKVTEFYTSRFAAEAVEQSGNTNYVPLSTQEVGLLSTAVKSVATINPSAFGDRFRFESAVISQLKDSGVPLEKAVSLGTRVGANYDVDQLAQLRTAEVPSDLAVSKRVEVNAKAVAAYLYDVYARAYVQPGRTDKLPKALQAKKVALSDVRGWVNAGQDLTPEAKAFFKLPEVSRVMGEISGAGTRSSSPATPIQNILASVKVADQAAVPTLAADDKLHEYLTGIATNSTRNAEEKFDPARTTVSLRAIAFQATKNPAFGERVASARNVGELTAIVGAEVQADPQFAQNVSTGDLAKLKDSDLKQVGGIDLSSDKMGLQIKRDGNGVALPISDQDIKDLRIDGLAPVILDIQPATPASVPFLMNLANTAQSK